MKHLYAHRILYYHVVADELPEIYLRGTNARSFEQQLKWLKNLGYHFVPLSEAVQGNCPSNSKTLSVTFDDGFACNYSALLPLIKRYQLQPTLFLIGKCIDNLALAWNHKLIVMQNRVAKAKLEGLVAELLPGATLSNLFTAVPMSRKDEITDALWQETMTCSQEEYLAEKQPFLNKDQIAELLKSGAELGSHSHSHPDFSRLSLLEATAEVKSSFEAINKHGTKCKRLFAYPYGKPCDPLIAPAFIEDLNLDATLGTRYLLGNNLLPQKLWQRQNMEGAARENIVEFFAKPWLRKWRERKS